jgi:hypothetical protein
MKRGRQNQKGNKGFSRIEALIKNFVNGVNVGTKLYLVMPSIGEAPIL